MNPLPWTAIFAQLFSLLVGVVAYRKNSVSVSGLAALLIISSMFIWFDKIALLFVLFFMFASSSYLSHYKRSQKKDLEEVVAKHGPRDYVQAICNLGVATLLVFVDHFQSNPAIIAAVVGSVAAANADSWASEIGALSKKTPVLITTFKPVPKGISGGVTMKGTWGGVAGSLFITVTAVIALQCISPFGGSIALLYWAAFIAGIFGFLFDSLIGAVCQSLYRNTHTQNLTEDPEGNKLLIKGFRWMNNDLVNLLTTAAGALIAGTVYALTEYFSN